MFFAAAAAACLFMIQVVSKFSTTELPIHPNGNCWLQKKKWKGFYQYGLVLYCAICLSIPNKDATETKQKQKRKSGSLSEETRPTGRAGASVTVALQNTRVGPQPQ